MGEVKMIQVGAMYGRKQNQKMKPYVVVRYLMEETDERILSTYGVSTDPCCINNTFIEVHAGDGLNRFLCFHYDETNILTHRWGNKWKVFF